MYTEEEYKKRVKELEPLAKELIMKKSPVDVRELASTMDPNDAYILGRHIGGLGEVYYHMYGIDLRGYLKEVVDMIVSHIPDGGQDGFESH